MQKEKPHIFLLTSDFPYGNSEPYLFDELKVAEQLKLSLTIVPLFVNEMSKKEENVLGFEVLNITNDYNSSKISLTEKLILLGVHL